MTEMLHAEPSRTIISSSVIDVVWWRYFDAVACPEEEGGFSVFARNYPGVISQAESLAEAKLNIAEAFLLMCDVAGDEMEYSDSPWMPVPADSQQIQVKVGV